MQDAHESPRFRIGDWVKVYCGTYEGHEFLVKGNRYENGEWEFLYDWPLQKVWYRANQLTLLRSAGING